MELNVSYTNDANGKIAVKDVGKKLKLSLKHNDDVSTFMSKFRVLQWKSSKRTYTPKLKTTPSFNPIIVHSIIEKGARCFIKFNQDTCSGVLYILYLAGSIIMQYV